MIQQAFAANLIEIIKNDPAVIGMAAGGSWITNEIDDYSDLDLVLVTREKISNDPDKMLAYARRFGKLLSGFTGEHVGEPRVLICLYDEPLLHVDIKFLVLDELTVRVETPEILYDTDDQLKKKLSASTAKFPYPSYQWIEDRFWTWVHYGLLKIGRGEYFEALDFLSALRQMVLGPLLLVKHGNLPRGVRKVETQLPAPDMELLKKTIATHDRASLLQALENCIHIYRDLRTKLFDKKIVLQSATEEKVMQYFLHVRQETSDNK